MATLGPDDVTKEDEGAMTKTEDGEREHRTVTADEEREAILRHVIEHREWAREPGRFSPSEAEAVEGALNAMIRFCDERRSPPVEPVPFDELHDCYRCRTRNPRERYGGLCAACDAAVYDGAPEVLPGSYVEPAAKAGEDPAAPLPVSPATDVECPVCGAVVGARCTPVASSGFDFVSHADRRVYAKVFAAFPPPSLARLAAGTRVRVTGGAWAGCVGRKATVMSDTGQVVHVKMDSEPGTLALASSLVTPEDDEAPVGPPLVAHAMDVITIAKQEERARWSSVLRAWARQTSVSAARATTEHEATMRGARLMALDDAAQAIEDENDPPCRPWTGEVTPSWIHDPLRAIGHACLDWVEDMGQCHLCGFDDTVPTPHDEDCPVGLYLADEDARDVALVEARRGEPTVPLAEVMRMAKAEEATDAEVEWHRDPAASGWRSRAWLGGAGATKDRWELIAYLCA